MKPFYNVRLSASPINWCNDDMTDLGDEYSFEDILADMERLHIQGTEMGRKYPRDPQTLRPALAAHQLVLSSAWNTVHFANQRQWPAELAQFSEHVRFLKAMGASHVVTCEGGGSVHWDLGGDRASVIPFSDEEWHNVARGLNEAGNIAHSYGLHLAYHPHMGTNVQTEDEIDRLMALTDPRYVTLLLDTGHIQLAGGDPLDVLKKYRQRIEYVHLKDVRQERMQQFYAQQLSFLQGVRFGIFTTPGDGCVDFPAILAYLAETDYQGWMVIEAEQDPAVANPALYMRKALAYLAGLGLHC
ncbi:myo-inosose-2 dehydratase [Ktedonosporobacter rubrisoli]|uniref:Myo-inosose-2 dehydratase n=1 Tax=Ktedonosporobacter rubrisoli TaxID=2509675 RepID=A0A4V0YZ86_KTERU|nr:myo-inosose-2 dehydratase [Ktedonosporobacter rubrisoli]QBD78851.1 myo-inosose-2 dehydratase [Ktedonosporobacter rubrisoli]